MKPIIVPLWYLLTIQHHASYQAQLRQVMEKWKAVDGVIYIRTSVDTAKVTIQGTFLKEIDENDKNDLKNFFNEIGTTTQYSPTEANAGNEIKEGGNYQDALPVAANIAVNTPDDSNTYKQMLQQTQTFFSIAQLGAISSSRQLYQTYNVFENKFVSKFYQLLQSKANYKYVYVCLEHQLAGKTQAHMGFILVLLGHHKKSLLNCVKNAMHFPLRKLEMIYFMYASYF